jgi:hypothetical protein
MNGAHQKHEITAVTQTQSPPQHPTREPATRAGLAARLGRIPGWGWVLIIYAASRVITTGILAFFYALAPTFGWNTGDYATRPGFLQFMDSWDGKYYERVALHGYPTQLPLDIHGNVEPNAWAFLPIYPWLTRGLMTVAGLNFAVAGVLLATLFGGGAAYLLYRLLLPRVGTRSALWAVIFFCVGPMSFVLQVTYAESLFLVLVFASLIAMAHKRYLLMIPFGVVAAFTHPGALALPAALGILFLAGIIRREKIRWTERARMIVAALAISVAGFAWPVVASTVTGSHGAYFETELSWWTGYVGRTNFVPFTPWFVMSNKYLGGAGIVLVLVVVGLFVWAIQHRTLRVLGDDILAFSGSYAAYLVAVFLPQQSLVRLMLPLSPLLGAPILTRSVVFRRVAVGVLIASQVLTISTLWVLGPP